MKQKRTEEQPRRERGIFERPKDSGVWWVRYADENGCIHREKVGSKSRARTLYEKRKTQVREHRLFPEQFQRRDVQISDAVRAYVAARKDRRSHKDLARYGRHWTEALGQKSLRQITPSDVERYVAERLGAVSRQTVRHEINFLKRIFRRAIQDGAADRNPAAALTPVKVSNQRVRFLSVEEEDRLRKAVAKKHWSVIAFALHTGLRQGEQFGLRWEDVDFRNNVITIPRSKHGDTRRVPINKTARRILAKLPRVLRCRWVFAHKTGGKINAHNLYRRTFVPALAEAKISDFTWHDLRHTYASRLVMSGVDLRTVQELLGHKTQAMTVRYAHLSPQHQHRAVEALDGFAARERTGTRTGTSARRDRKGT